MCVVNVLKFKKIPYVGNQVKSTRIRIVYSPKWVKRLRALRCGEDMHWQSLDFYVSGGMFRGALKGKYFLFKNVCLTDVASLKFFPCREYFSAVLSTLRGEESRYGMCCYGFIKIKKKTMTIYQRG